MERASIPAPGSPSMVVLDPGVANPGQSQEPSGLAQLLGQREEFYRSILDSLAEGLVITDADSRIVYANRAMEALSGYSREELLGRVSYAMLSPRKNWACMRRRLRERLAGKTESYEHELLRKDGKETWIRVRATPYRDAQGAILGTVGAIHCIDRQKCLERENEYLLAEIRREQGAPDLLGQSLAWRKVLDQIRMVAPTEAAVLIAGESGVGKELAARAIHEQSVRRARPLIRVNCPAVPKDLFESEFFGHVQGAFTGAVRDRVGRFELANGGTLFLDEVGEIPLDLQSKLLRVLQEGQFERVGDDRTRSVDVRLIAASNRDLLAEAKAGRFRLDLYYRLSVFPIAVPPLRERREDIAPLAAHFLSQAAHRLGRPVSPLTPDQARELQAYDWPGNVRELQIVVERAAILAQGGPVRFHLQPEPAPAFMPAATPGAGDFTGDAPAASLSLPDLKARERALIAQALQQTRGRIYGPSGAAALLGLKPTTLASKIQRWGIDPAPTSDAGRQE